MPYTAKIKKMNYFTIKIKNPLELRLDERLCQSTDVEFAKPFVTNWHPTGFVFDKNGGAAVVGHVRLYFSYFWAMLF